MPDFEDVVAILERRGYARLTSEEGFCWEHGRPRVRLSAPKEASPHFPYVIGRQRYEDAAGMSRWLNPQTSALPIERSATAERLADMVEDQLKNPY